MAERTRLGDTIESWLRRRSVSLAHVVTHGKVSRNTIWMLTQGDTKNPEAETLRKIARGIATDRYTGVFERPVYRAVLADLGRAAGMDDIVADIPPSDLESEIRAITRDPTVAELWADFIRDNPNATPDQIRIVRTLFDGIARLGDER